MFSAGSSEAPQLRWSRTDATMLPPSLRSSKLGPQGPSPRRHGYRGKPQPCGGVTAGHEVHSLEGTVQWFSVSLLSCAPTIWVWTRPITCVVPLCRSSSIPLPVLTTADHVCLHTRSLLFWTIHVSTSRAVWASTPGFSHPAAWP